MRVEIKGNVSLPDFIVVGAGKSGTTSLHRILKHHPDIFLPQLKELQFFNIIDNPNVYLQNISKKVPTNFWSYCGMFHDSKPEQKCGDITPAYLFYHRITIPNIRKYHPNWKEVRIMAILRNPIDKILSQYRHQLMLGNEDKNINAAIAEEKNRDPEKVAPGLLYLQTTLYQEQVKAYFDAFPYMKVFLFEDLVVRPENFFSQVFKYLEVKDMDLNNVSLRDPFNPTKKRIENMSLSDKARKHLLKWPSLISSRFLQKNFDLIDRDSLNTESRMILYDRLMPDIIKLEALLEMDLNSWKNDLENLKSSN